MLHVAGLCPTRSIASKSELARRRPFASFPAWFGAASGDSSMTGGNLLVIALCAAFFRNFCTDNSETG